MLLTCPRCASTLDMDDAMQGRFVMCGTCSETFQADGIRVGADGNAPRNTPDPFSGIDHPELDDFNRPTLTDVRREIRRDQAEDRSNSFGITSLIRGIGCICLAAVPALARNEFLATELSILKALIVPISIVGLILAICGCSWDKGKGFAIAGAVLNMVWVLVTIYSVMLLIAASRAAVIASKQDSNPVVGDAKLFDDVPDNVKKPKAANLKPPETSDLPAKASITPEMIEAAAKEPIARAIKQRELLVARREAIIALNKELADKHGKEIAQYEATKEEYDAKLPKWQAAKREADAVRRLEFSRKLQANIDAAETQAGAEALRDRLTRWYRELVKEFPDTAAAKEAKNRLAGKKPMNVAAPKVGSEPVAPAVPRIPRFEPEGRPIPPVDVEAIKESVRRKLFE